MANQWYFAREGATSGPFSATQLQALAAAGQLRPEDSVWKEGMTRRVVAAKVDKLFAAAAGPALPAPPPAPAPARRPAPEPAAASPPPLPTVAGSGTLAERLATGEELGLAPGVILWEETVPAEPAPPPEEEAAVAQKPPPPRQPASNLRVLGVKGGTISSQDGKVVKFRKICLRCGYADTSMTTMPIRKGTTRVNFFCPKCRKSQQSEVTGAG